MRQQGWGKALTARQAEAGSEHRKYPTDREWLKTQDTIKETEQKGQTLGSKNDTRAKKNQTWPRWLENEPDKQEVVGRRQEALREEDPGSGPSITILLDCHNQRKKFTKQDRK